MGGWDNDGGLKESEYEILYVIRDLLKLFTEQQMAIYGRTTETLDGISRLLDECIGSYDA